MSYYHLFLTSALMSSGLLSFSSEAAAMTLTQSTPPNGFTYTHTSTPSTESAPFAKFEYKIAAVCFMGLGGCADGGYFSKAPDGGSGGSGGYYDIDTKKQCLNEGFTLTSCSTGSAATNLCPYDNRYFQKCVSIAQACNDKGFGSSCEDGKILDSTQSCDYDHSYQKCKCDPCSGYNYYLEDAVADGYTTDGEGCNACGVMKYKRRINDCKGFSECECGGEIGSAVCWSGSLKKFANCKRCACPNGTIDIESYWCNGDFKCLFGGR